ncbi:MAG TPA: FHA domain-containing protein [Acidimicrobiales bacterium]|nr:FHA domain-containing protein [Acidimicrobiales bacterium]
MSDQVLNILKYFLLALVWLFVLRILRVVWVEIRSADGAGGPAAPGDVAAREGVIPAGRRRRVPRAPAGPPPVAAPPAPAPRPASAPRPSARRPARLRVVEPADLAGRTYPLEGGGEVVLGRTTDSGVALPADSFVSSRHARVFPRGDEMWVEDLGSTNGTFVNSARISAPTVLRPGDRLQVGRTVLEVDG